MTATARPTPPPRAPTPTPPSRTGTATRSSGSSCTGACTRSRPGPMCSTAVTSRPRPPTPATSTPSRTRTRCASTAATRRTATSGSTGSATATRTSPTTGIRVGTPPRGSRASPPAPVPATSCPPPSTMTASASGTRRPRPSPRRGADRAATSSPSSPPRPVPGGCGWACTTPAPTTGTSPTPRRGHDWHVTDFPHLPSNHDLFARRRNDPAFAVFAAAQLRELIDRFAPDILWNAIDWPDAGKYDGPDSLQQLFRDHLAAVPHGMVNDRWGVPVHGVLTREYQDITSVQAEPFESTRGLGLSFGYNADESAEHALDGAELIRLLVDVVSKNGNLLINVGPRADGSVPALQSAALEQLGEWLAAHGEAIYGTRPWFHDAVTTPPDRVRFTLGTTADGSPVLHALLLDPAAGAV